MSALSTLNKDELITYLQTIIDSLNGFDEIIGDVPVSEQLSIALSKMADKSHTHENYVVHEEFNKLKTEVERLTSLIGDTSVSEQTSEAIKKTNE